MTNTPAATTEGAKRSSQFPRTANTLRLSALMDERHRLEIASRIIQLREQSRWTQPQLAEKLGLSLRGYQKLEERGTTKWERAEEIAEIHGASAEWIWSGKERSATPDPFAEPAYLTDLRDQLKRIESIVRENRETILEVLAERDAADERRAASRSTRQAKPPRADRKQRATGN